MEKSRVKIPSKHKSVRNYIFFIAGLLRPWINTANSQYDRTQVSMTDHATLYADCIARMNTETSTFQ